MERANGRTVDTLKFKRVEKSVEVASSERDLARTSGTVDKLKLVERWTHLNLNESKSRLKLPHQREIWPELVERWTNLKWWNGGQTAAPYSSPKEKLSNHSESDHFGSEKKN